MMAQDGISDYSFAKRKAARQLGVEDANCLPGNAEIETELRLYLQLYLSESHPASLRQLRSDALATMNMLERFDPQLTGPVLDGTAGRYAETDIHLFADNAKEVEFFLLNNKIPYQTSARLYHSGHEQFQIPIFTLEGPSGPIHLSIFSPDDIRSLPRNNAENIRRARAPFVESLISEADP